MGRGGARGGDTDVSTEPSTHSTEPSTHSPKSSTPSRPMKPTTAPIEAVDENTLDKAEIPLINVSTKQIDVVPAISNVSARSNHEHSSTANAADNSMNQHQWLLLDCPHPGAQNYLEEVMKALANEFHADILVIERNELLDMCQRFFHFHNRHAVLNNNLAFECASLVNFSLLVDEAYANQESDVDGSMGRNDDYFNYFPVLNADLPNLMNILARNVSSSPFNQHDDGSILVTVNATATNDASNSNRVTPGSALQSVLDILLSNFGSTQLSQLSKTPDAADAPLSSNNPNKILYFKDLGNLQAEFAKCVKNSLKLKGGGVLIAAAHLPTLSTSSPTTPSQPTLSAPSSIYESDTSIHLLTFSPPSTSTVVISSISPPSETLTFLGAGDLLKPSDAEIVRWNELMETGEKERIAQWNLHLIARELQRKNIAALDLEERANIQSFAELQAKLITSAYARRLVTLASGNKLSQSDAPLSINGEKVVVGAGNFLVALNVIEANFTLHHHHRHHQLDTKSRLLKSISSPLNTHEQKLLTSCIIAPESIQTRFNDIAGLETVKQSLHSMIALPLLRSSLFQFGVLKNSVSGVLLFGPPGTGKTMLAKAVAAECGSNFMSISPSVIFDLYVGEGEKNAKV